MTARQIIEARLGHPLAPTRELRPDERQAVKRLALQLIRNRAAQRAEQERREELSAIEAEVENERAMLKAEGAACAGGYQSAREARFDG